MNVELFIARRVFSQKENKKGISNRIVSIAVASISLGLAIMIISVGVLLGFKSQIREKIIGFGAHFQVVNFDSNQSYETTPIEIDSLLIQSYRTVKQVTHIQFYATKPGMIKTDDNIHGIILKGVDENYDWTFFSKNLTDGKLPALTKGQLSNEVLISEKISKLLKLNTGDPLFCYFYNEGESAPRSRRFSISGIYRTSLEDFDQLFVFSDIKQIQALNNWATNEVSGYELLIDDFNNIDRVFPIIRGITLNAASEHSMLKVFSVLTRYPALFDWLSILDVNVWVLLFLMIGVAGINMISGLLIIIIERTRMIGILKALGFPNLSVRKVFLYLTAFLSIKGMIWGNVIGIGLCILQYSTGLIRLNPELYYIDTVPIAFDALFIFAINMGSLLSIIAMIILPTVLISRITPVEAIAVE